jgi:hypothetical protein
VRHALLDFRIPYIISELLTVLETDKHIVLDIVCALAVVRNLNVAPPVAPSAVASFNFEPGAAV